MAKTMTPSVMTDGQIERAIEIFRAQLRKHQNELPSEAVQIVLGQSKLGHELLAVLRKRVEAVRGTIVTVDRSVRPTYPYWMDKVIHLELENTGPSKYDLVRNVLLWLHDDQKKGGRTTGQTIYDYLKKHDMLKSCLGLQDALAIQKLGVAVFQKVFGNNVVYFWKSVVWSRGEELNIPHLYVRDGEVVLDWFMHLRYYFDSHHPAVRFASS